jgi:hypothetical protein
LDLGMKRFVWPVMIVAACGGHDRRDSSPRAAPRDAGALTWQWQGPEPGHGQRPQLDGPDDATFLYVNDESSTAGTVTRQNRDGIVWRHDLGAEFGGSAAFALDADRGVLYVAQFPQISQGATLFALDARDGRELWKTAAKGYPLVGHSQYLNAVELRVSGGALVVFGWESSGKYVETHDLATGKLLSHAIVR